MGIKDIFVIHLPTIVLGTLLLPLLPIGLCYIQGKRWIVRALASFVRPDLTMLSSISSIFPCLDDLQSPLATMTWCLELDANSVTQASLTEAISTALEPIWKSGKYRELRCFYFRWGTYWFWKEDADFSLAHHVKMHESATTTTQCSESDLKKIMTQLQNAPYAPNKSPWDITIVPNCRNNRTVLLWRTHHGLSDPFSGLMMTMSLSQTNAKAKFSWYSNKGKCKRRRLLEKVQAILYVPYEMIFHMLVGIGKMTYGPERAQRTRQLSVACMENLPVNLIKEVSKGHDVAFASVVTAANCGVLREMFLQKSLTIPESILVGAPIYMPDHLDQLYNATTLSLMRIPLKLEDPINRLKVIDVEYKKLKDARLIQSTYYMFKYFVSALSSIELGLSLKLSSRFQLLPTTSGLVNFKGPTERFDICGHPLVNLGIIVGGDFEEVDLVQTAFSYGDQVTLATVMREHVTKDQNFVQSTLSTFCSELQRLKDMIPPATKDV